MAGQTTSMVSSQQAMSVFAFFLFCVYAVFGGMLAIFRDDIIKEGELKSIFIFLFLSFNCFLFS